MRDIGPAPLELFGLRWPKSSKGRARPVRTARLGNSTYVSMRVSLIITCLLLIGFAFTHDLLCVVLLRHSALPVTERRTKLRSLSPFKLVR